VTRGGIPPLVQRLPGAAVPRRRREPAGPL